MAISKDYKLLQKKREEDEKKNLNFMQNGNILFVI